MAWTASKIFDSAIQMALDRGTANSLIDYDGDIIKCATYDGTLTPDRTVAETASRYGTGIWLAAAEVWETGQWASGGVQSASTDITIPAGGTIMLDGNDVSSGTGYTTKVNNGSAGSTHGCLMYSDTSANKAGICFLYFGGANQVTTGQLTVQFNTNGMFRITT